MLLKQTHRLTPIGELRKHPRNPRRGDVAAIKSSIRRNGFFGEVIAQTGTGYILAGNHRYEAAVDSGMLEIPCCWVECDERVALKILLADNRTGDLGHYNDNLLAGVLKELDQTGAAFDGTGYTQQDYAAIMQSLDARIAPPEERSLAGGADQVRICFGEYQGFATRASYQRLIAQVPDPTDKDLVREFLRKKVGLPCL